MCAYAKVVLFSQARELDRTFDYAVPKALEGRLKEGMRVIVPFGKKNARAEGCITGFSDRPEGGFEVKEIYGLMEDFPIFSPHMLALAEWMADTYYAPLSACLCAIMPSGIRFKSVWMAELADFGYKAQRRSEADIIDFLNRNNGSALRPEMEDALGALVWKRVLELEKKGVLTITQKSVIKNFEKRICRLFINDCADFSAEYKRIAGSGRLSAQKSVLDYISEFPGAQPGEVRKALEISASPISTLLKRGIIRSEWESVRRSALGDSDAAYEPKPEMTEAQTRVYEEITAELEQEEKKPVLLHGITGSGKTEIYIRIIEDIINKGKQAIVLVPEISLTPQTVSRFVSRLGAENVSVTHSRMSPAERLDQWKKAKNNEVLVMIGPRSAIFTPFDNLGVIIMDEEHESSYISEVTPKYNAKETAGELARLTGAMLIQGSATPDVCAYHCAVSGEMRLAELCERPSGVQPPSVFIEDMRLELRNGNTSILSAGLHSALRETLEAGEQAMLFINRRGHSTFISCRSCGHVMTCPECSVSYTYHSWEKRLVCHYCGKTAEPPELCPECGSKYIKHFGSGTQKVEAEVGKLFPDAVILRMDFDTTSGKNSYEKILSAFRRHEADILVGTQMIAKGHDFPDVTLSGILAADLALYSGSYRAGENAFQLITQAAGRAGRAKKQGRVFIQTYNPENYSVRYAAAQDYKAFYSEEIAIRRSLGYPPFASFFTVLISGRDEKAVEESAVRMGEIFKYYGRNRDFVLLGPAPAAISKIKSEYRWRLTVKHADRKRLQSYTAFCTQKHEQYYGKRDIFVSITLNPYGLI